MQKKFGQNFLINPDARKKLIDCLDINENTKVWEIGPGLGAMTSEILERGADLTVFEIDRGFISLISDFFKPYSDKNKFKKTRSPPKLPAMLYTKKQGVGELLDILDI